MDTNPSRPGSELHEIAPGAIHLPGWLDLHEQRRLAASFEQWARSPVPIRSATVRGGQMSVRTVCLGWHWRPYRYSRFADDVNGAAVAALPAWLSELARRAVGDAYGPDAATSYRPDVSLINYYDEAARMGLHQDKDEKVLEPVVSLSVGDSCRFRFGNVESRNKPYTDVDLRSGDAFVFGRESRLAFHGVTKVYPGTAPDGCGLDQGRINLTLRMTGLT
jgi:alkylated DNA repair protein (DNA oxidative demethylase)